MDEAESYLFGLFEKVRCLRETARGEVWLGADRAGRPVIYKRIRRTGLPLAELKALSHPLWPEIYAFFEDAAAGETHILEECVQGEPLSRRIELEHYLTEREARRYLLALADGLAVLHAHRILHRDIKPENLIEQRDGTIRLIDFDAARLMGAEGEEKAADTVYLGTRGYAPPEQYGYGATDARSDIYALGMTMQELLGPDYHGSLARICRRAAEVDPKRRYQNICALVRDVRYGRRIRFAKGMAALAILAVLAVAAYLFYLAQAKPEKLEELETTPVEELVRHPEELKPNTRRDDVKKKEQEAQPPSGGATVIQTGGGEEASGAKAAETAADDAKDKAAEPAAEEEKPREEIRVHYYMDGTCFNAWTDAYDYPINNATGIDYIPPSTWQTWAGDDDARIFPDGAAWHIRVNVQNTTQNTYPAPVLHMEYNDGAETTVRDYEAPALVPGGSIDFDVPLAGLRIVNPGEEGYHARTMQLEVRGIDHQLFGGQMPIDFIPKARPNFGW